MSIESRRPLNRFGLRRLCLTMLEAERAYIVRRQQTRQWQPLPVAVIAGGAVMLLLIGAVAHLFG